MVRVKKRNSSGKIKDKSRTQWVSTANLNTVQVEKQKRGSWNSDSEQHSQGKVKLTENETAGRMVRGTLWIEDEMEA